MYSRQLFPKVSNTILKKLRMTDIALYSIIPSKNAYELSNYIEQLLHKYKKRIQKQLLMSFKRFTFIKKILLIQPKTL